MTQKRYLAKILAVLLALAIVLPVVPASAVTVTPDLSYRFYMVGNSHIDTAWRWPIQHTAEEIIRDTFTRQVNALKTNSTYRFTSSCSTHYKWTKEYYPAMYEDIKDLFNKGQWGIAGGQFVEPDLNVMEGETFVRHGLYAQHFFLEELGQIAKVALVPDVFGFSGQFPQFIRKTGMTAYVATKMNWSSDPADGALDPGPWSQSSNGQNAKGRESDLFWWEAIDGTDVLSYNCYNDYTSSYSTGDFRTSSNQVFNRISRSGSFTLSNQPVYGSGTFYYDYDSNIKYALGMFGSGDHGGGPNTGTALGSHGGPAANSGGTGGPVVLPATLEEYFRDVRIPGVGTNNNANGANRSTSLMTLPGVSSLDKVYRHVGENYLSYHRGTYTSWSRVKKYNRQLNNLSQMAEQAATLGFWTKSLDNNSNEKIETSWERICINTMHDILPGSSGPIEYYQVFMNAEMCKNLLINIQNNALAALAYRANTSVDAGVPVFVYNPLSWQRDGETTTSVKLDRGYPYIKVFDGATEMPATVISNRPDGAAEISFIAKGVPSLGYKVYKVVGSDTPSDLTTDVSVTENASSFIVENDSLRFTLSKTTGNMPSLINKKDGNREVFYQTSSLHGNELQYKTDTGGSSFPAWDMTNSEFGGVTQTFNRVNTVAETPSIVYNSPEKVTIKVSQRISGGSYSSGNYRTNGNTTLVRYITLLAGSDKIDVHFDLDWQMYQNNLKVAFPVAVDARAASYEIAYGALDGATELKRMNAVIPASSASNPLMSNSLTGPMPWAGAEGRATVRDTRWNAARFEQSGHKWMDVTGDNGLYGMSILNDAKYGHDVLRMVRSGNATDGTGTDGQIPATPANGTYVRARMTVVRSPRSAANDYQRANQVPNPTNQVVDVGEQNFNYSIYPHAGTWQVGKTSMHAHELNFPLQSFQAAASAGDGILGSEKSFLSLNKDNVIIGAVKNQHDEQENRNKLIVRVWETNGANTTGVTLTLPSVISAAREVNMLEHNYNELSNDNIDNPVSKKLEAKPIAISGNTATFDIGKYEVLTMEFVIAPYAGTQLELKQSKVDLSAYFNIRGTSPDSNRRAANLDAAGNSIPEPLWKEAREAGVDYMGIKFQLGPDAAPNFVTAAGQSIPLSGTGYSKVFLLGLAGKYAAPGGKFTVNYTDGTSDEKAIMFADWRSPLTGWVPMDQMDSKPYVYDSIAQVFTHWHDQVQDMMTFDNYLYVYFIDIDESKTLASITLPDAAAAKVAGITLVNSEIPGFGSTDEGKNEEGATDYYWDFQDLATGTTGTVIDKLHISATATRKPWAILLAGPGGAGGAVPSGEGPQNTTLNDGATKFCGDINSSNNFFIYDAGEPIREASYIIRGANDDNSYTGRCLHTWTVDGSTSPDGPWVNISSPGAQGSGWNANYQTRTFNITWPSSAPAEGYRYYRLTITRAARTAGGSDISAGYMVQFSFFGFFPDLMWQNGNLTTTVSNNVPVNTADAVNINSMNGTRIVTLAGTLATDTAAPFTAKTITNIKGGLYIKVAADTKFCYAFKPSSNASAYMSLDLRFDDGSSLKDIVGAVDQYGIGVSPVAQGAGGKLVNGEWNYVEIDLGSFAEGRFISQIQLAYETNAGTSGAAISGAFDNVAIWRGESKTANVYTALYKADGKMHSFSLRENVAMSGFNTVVLNPAIAVDKSGAGVGSYVKVFLWDDDFIPLTAAFQP